MLRFQTPAFGELVNGPTAGRWPCKEGRSPLREKGRGNQSPNLDPESRSLERRPRCVDLKPWTVSNRVPSLDRNNQVTEDKTDALG